MILILVIATFILPFFIKGTPSKDIDDVFRKLTHLLLIISSTSIIQFWGRVFGIHWIITLTITFILIVSLIYFNKNTFSLPRITVKSFSFTKPQSVALLGSSIAVFLFGRYAKIWGGWDGWVIWNMHGKFLTDPLTWSTLFNNQIEWTHPDYPLMLPETIALVWKSINVIHPAVPFYFSLLTLVMILSLVWNSLSTSKRVWLPVIAIIIISLDRHFIAQVASQYADSLIALFYLASTVFFLKMKETNWDYFILGVLASSGAWVKNEGMVFFLIFSFFILINFVFKILSNDHKVNSPTKNILFYLLGTIPILLTWIYFKQSLAPSNILIASQSYTELLNSLFSFSRLTLVVQYLSSSLFFRFPIIIILSIIVIYMSLTSKKKEQGGKSKLLFSIILITFIIYMAMYMITPYDQEWHIKHSIERLIHQFYPALLVLMIRKIDILSDYRKFKVV